MKYSAFCLTSILLVPITTMIIPSIMAFDRTRLVFLNHFTSKKNAFMTVYALSMLEGDYQEYICSQFDIKEKMIAHNSIYLACLDPSSSLQPTKTVSLIPAIACIPWHGDIFYVTYSQKHEYFKLRRTNEKSSEILLVEVLFSNIIYFESNILEDVANKLLEFFNSESYTKTAKLVLESFIEQRDWPKICKQFASDYEYVPGQSQKEIVQISTTIHDDTTKFDIPALSCPGNNEDQNIFYVAYYTNNIYFRIDVDLTLARNYATYDLAYTI